MPLRFTKRETREEARASDAAPDPPTRCRPGPAAELHRRPHARRGDSACQQENISQTLDVIRARCRQSPRADHGTRYTPPGPYTAITGKTRPTGKREDNSSGRYTREGVRFNFFRTFGRSSILPRHARVRGYYMQFSRHLKKKAADVKTPREGTP